MGNFEGYGGRRMSFSSFNGLLDCMVGLLSEEFGKEATVVRQFPPKTKPHPLDKITVAIGAKKRSFNSKCIGNVLTNSHSGREMSAEIEAAVYVPLTIDSKEAYSTIDRVFEILRADSRFGITGAEHGVLSSNRTTGSFELHGTLISTLYETEE